MRAILSTIAVVGIVVLLALQGVRAHHAFSAEFDGDKPVLLVGTVTKLLWINPHLWIEMDVTGADGKVVNWSVEGGPPNTMVKRGWRREDLPPGVQIVVQGFRARDGSSTANGNTVTLPDGRTLFVGSSGSGAPYDRSGSGQ